MIKKYFLASLQELHNVTWPTKNKAIRITTIVFIFMVISAIALGFVDQLLTWGYQALLNLK